MLHTFKANVRGLVESVNKIFQLMAVTRSGICGAGAVRHVVEELSNAFVHAPSPGLQTVARAAVYLDELSNHEYVINSAAQFAGMLRATLTVLRRRKAVPTIENFVNIVS